ncbi:hypothetical protein VUR80DRAFT_4271 [Thermomyces stellatus]
MHSATFLAAFVTTATLTLANSVTFVSQDSTSRTIVFTPSHGHDEIPDLKVAGYAEETATFPDGWEGNWYAVPEGKEGLPGMLGEVAFGGYSGETYFDVSAIVNPDDNSGVKQMWPAVSKEPKSGCETFPCDTVYNQPDDVQTKSTKETDLICTLGG